MKSYSLSVPPTNPISPALYPRMTQAPTLARREPSCSFEKSAASWSSVWCFLNSLHDAKDLDFYRGLDDRSYDYSAFINRLR